MSRYHGPGREMLEEYAEYGKPSRRVKALKRVEAEDRCSRTFTYRTAEYRRITAKAEHHKASRAVEREGKGGGKRG